MDRAYWFFRNLAAFILNTITFPFYLVMFVLETFWDGLRIVFTTNGSEVLQYPWEIEWPFFRKEDGEE